MQTLVRPGEQTEHIGLALAELADGEPLTVQEGPETVAVILSGIVEAQVGGVALGEAGGRRSVFDGPAHAVMAPAGAALSLRAARGPAVVAVATAAGTSAGTGPPAARPAPGGEGVRGAGRVIRPEDQRIAQVGDGNWSRTVRTILGPEHEAGRLLVGETINPPGNWSSYPPHRHDRDDPGREVALEEVYLYKVEPSGGFGVQVRYDEAGKEEAFIVRDGDVAAIRSGYHPVVAAGGYTLYYLWVMAGAGREMVPYLDPDHAWVQAGR